MIIFKTLTANWTTDANETWWQNGDNDDNDDDFDDKEEVEEEEEEEEEEQEEDDDDDVDHGGVGASSNDDDDDEDDQCCQLCGIIRENPDFGPYLPVSRLEYEISRIFSEVCSLVVDSTFRQ